VEQGELIASPVKALKHEGATVRRPYGHYPDIGILSQEARFAAAYGLYPELSLIVSVLFRVGD
jgi:hypothetical protein